MLTNRGQSVFASIVIFADFHRILAVTGANDVKCCEISDSQMPWEIPLTAFDTLINKHKNGNN